MALLLPLLLLDPRAMVAQPRTSLVQTTWMSMLCSPRCGIIGAPVQQRCHDVNRRAATLQMAQKDDDEKPALSMEALKKYGVAGTVAYVLTELVFWAIALPVACTTYFQTTGHWPDFGDNTDRATVLGFVFAGANIARLAVPLRFGAAFALAPWVDENIVSRFKKSDE